MELQTIFVIISSFILAFIAYLIPKKMKLYDIYATSLFAALFGLFVDTILAVKYQFYILDKPGIQIPALIGQVVMYFATSIILLNFYPFDQPVKKKVIYILGFTLVTVVFEVICYKVGFIKYNEWKMWYSFLSYPFLIYFLVLHYKFFRWLVERST